MKERRRQNERRQQDRRRLLSEAEFRKMIETGKVSPGDRRDHAVNRKRKRRKVQY